MSQVEHLIVAGILQKPTRLVDVSSLRLEFFHDRLPRALFGYAVSFHRKRDGKNALDMALARSKLERSSSDLALPLLELLEEYESYSQVSDAEFREALADLVGEHQRSVIREGGTAALEAMIEGDFKTAKAEMRGALLEAEDTNLEDDRPVDIRSPAAIKEERERTSKPSPTEPPGFQTGFPRLHSAVSFRRKELTILGGYAADGKTQWSKSICYAANQAGANVFFVALEMTTEEIKALFIAQHAATLDPLGVNWVDALDNRLDRTSKKLWHAALDDFEVQEDSDGLRMESQGGKLIIWSPSKAIHQGQWADRLRAAKQEDDIDIAVKDYTELVKPRPKKGFANYRLDLKEMIDEDKALSRELDIWCIDNHQISRKGRVEAEKRGPPHYRMCDLGASSGLEQAADHFMWVYSDEELKDDREAKIGIGKARKGKTIYHGFHAYADGARGLIAEVAL